ncbi:hypothetical protein SCA6_001906 [Theobroma cacao]
MEYAYMLRRLKFVPLLPKHHCMQCSTWNVSLRICGYTIDRRGNSTKENQQSYLSAARNSNEG